MEGKTDKLNEKIRFLEAENKQLKLDKKHIAKELADAQLARNNLLAFYKEIEHELVSLKETESKLRKVLQLADNAVLFLKTTGEIDSFNTKALEIFGYENVAELKGKTLYDITADKDIEKSSIAFNKIINENATIRVEKVFKRNDGSEFPGLVTACLIDKDLALTAAIVQDITVQKEHEISQQGQITLLKNLSILKRGLSEAKSLKELKSNICTHLYKFTNASGVWIIKNVSNGFEKFYYGYDSPDKGFLLSNFSIKQNRSTPVFAKLLSYKKSTNFLKLNDTIKLPAFHKPEDIQSQAIISFKIKSGKTYFLGLNYNQENKYYEDIGFLKSVSPLLRPAFDSLEAYELLYENEAKFRGLIENQTDVIIVRDLQGYIKYVSPSIKNYGMETDELIGKATIDFIHDDDLEIASAAQRNILTQAGKTINIPKIRIILKKGIQVTAQLTITNLLNQKGIEGVIINIHDLSERVEFEEHIKESEENYRTLFENANDAIFLLNNEKIEVCNNKMLELFKAKHSQIIGKTLYDLSPEFQSNRENSMESSQKLLHWVCLDNKISYEWIHKRLDNSCIDVHVSLSPVKYSGKKYILGIISDITEIKSAHKKIEDNELRLRTIFESMNDGVFLCSDNFEISYMNQAMQNQLDIINIPKQHCYNSIYGFNKPCTWCKKSSTDLSTTVEDIYNEKNGKYYQVSRSKIKMNGETSNLHISRDITEIKLAQNLIAHSEEKFRNIFKYSSDAIFITDLDGNYREVNDQAISRTGFTRAEFLTKSFVNLSKFSKDNRAFEYLNEIKEHGQSSAEIYYLNYDSTEIFTEINGRLIDYENSKAILHISRDISARKEIERKVLEATIETEENERSRFAQDLHDGIGPYLSATKFFLKTLAMEEVPKERDVLVEKAVTSIDEIISNVKEISNNISPHVLRNFGIHSALNSFIKKLKITNIEIRIDSNIDGKRFNENLEISCFRILTELINNTLKHAKAKTIEITLSNNYNAFLINFSHDGLGFDFDETINNNKGQGLFNIINRVNSLKGKYEFNTTKNTNFQFQAIFTNI